jgi:small subunit ribosomal protein S9
VSKVIHTSGKRKSAIARATLREGKGKVTINKMSINHYHPQVLQMRLREPLILSEGISDKVDIDVVVHGGGMNGQTDAARLAIARALSEYAKGDKLKNVYLKYDRQLLVADVRLPETSKPNDSKPRAARQKSYR